MVKTKINSDQFAKRLGAYSHGYTVEIGDTKLIFTTGQIALDKDGNVSDEYDSIRSDYNPQIHIFMTYDYCVDKHETTQNEFEELMDFNPSYFSKCGGNCPVDSVTWNEANEYCTKSGKRLPTEIEWEFAARGSALTDYYWGNEIDGKYLWYAENADQQTHQVMKKLPNSNGLYDILGNVSEWVSDCYHNSRTVKDNDKINSEYMTKVISEECNATTLKGGSWDSLYRFGKSTLYTKEPMPKTVKYKFIGFRCAKMPK